MASRRKSTTPCMVPPRETVDSDQEMEDVAEAVEPEDSNGVVAVSSEVCGLPEERGEEADVRQASDPYLDLNMAEGGYECKYCSFQTSELNLFTMHVDTEHPDVVLNTSYVCMECDYHTRSYDTLLAHNARLHPGEDNFTRTMVKRNNETIFQQTVNDLTFDGSFIKVEDDEAEETSRKGIALSKTPIMRIKSRPEPKKFAAAHKMAIDDVIKVESDDEDDENKEPPTLSPAPMTPAAVTAPRLIPVSAPVQVQAVPQSIVVNSPNVLQIKGGSGGSAVLPPGTLAQVLSALQNQQSSPQTQTQLLIPISSIPTYNTAMDNNVLLVSAYNRFPYPSVSEIMGLSSQTKFSEEQIKVWFSAQRLKHGVSWTPEEVGGFTGAFPVSSKFKGHPKLVERHCGKRRMSDRDELRSSSPETPVLDAGFSVSVLVSSVHQLQPCRQDERLTCCPPSSSSPPRSGLLLLLQQLSPTSREYRYLRRASRTNVRKSAWKS